MGRLDGRGIAEERPGSAEYGGGERPPGVTQETVQQKVNRLARGKDETVV